MRRLSMRRAWNSEAKWGGAVSRQSGALRLHAGFALRFTGRQRRLEPLRLDRDLDAGPFLFEPHNDP